MVSSYLASPSHIPTMERKQCAGLFTKGCCFDRTEKSRGGEEKKRKKNGTIRYCRRAGS